MISTDREKDYTKKVKRTNMATKTTREYIELIEAWGEKTKISVNGKLGAQALKFASEYSEYKQNIDLEQSIKDDLGDMIVVLVMIAGLSKLKTREVLTAGFGQTTTQGKTESLIGRRMELLTDGVLKGNNLEVAIKLLYRDIVEVATRKRVMIADCLEMAYNDIKDREGITTSSGVFVKSTDAEYERIVAEEA
jgi:NTP pyrophosphatase (non-canonical NTP hydrolase)